MAFINVMIFMNVFHSLPDSFKVGTRMEAINALFSYISCAGSHSGVDLRNPVPGDEDFSRIEDGNYFTFSAEPFNVGEFTVLNQMFNGTHRSQTFTFPIFVDDVPEGVEELQLTLSLAPEQQLRPGAVNITPAVATVRIHDFSRKFIRLFDRKFIKVFYHGLSPNKEIFEKT